jgi:hypothetical protein
MALGQLLGRTGREAEARQLLEVALRDGRSRSVDPYWTYLVPPRIGVAQVAAWLDELGVEARRERSARGISRDLAGSRGERKGAEKNTAERRPTPGVAGAAGIREGAE